MTKFEKLAQLTVLFSFLINMLHVFDLVLLPFIHPSLSLHLSLSLSPSHYFIFLFLPCLFRHIYLSLSLSISLPPPLPLSISFSHLSLSLFPSLPYLIFLTFSFFSLCFCISQYPPSNSCCSTSVLLNLSGITQVAE